MPELILPQRSEEWLQARQGRITASLAAACLGLDPYQGPLAAFNQITGRRQGKVNNKHTRWGIENEQKGRESYEVFNAQLVTETGLWVHPHFDWLAASPDGLVGDDGLLEVKCPSKIPERVPVHHRIQMLVQLACTGRNWCDYFVWCGDNQTAQWRIMQCFGIVRIVERLEAFYLNHVKPDIPPKRGKK